MITITMSYQQCDGVKQRYSCYGTKQGAQRRGSGRSECQCVVEMRTKIGMVGGSCMQKNGAYDLPKPQEYIVECTCRSSRKPKAEIIGLCRVDSASCADARTANDVTEPLQTSLYSKSNVSDYSLLSRGNR